MRQELPAHPRSAAVGGDQHIAHRGRAILEMRDHALIAFLVAQEGLAELHNPVEARQQNLPQGDPADRAMLADGVALAHEVAADRQENTHPLGQKPNATAGPAAGAIEQAEQMRRQAGMQGAAAGRVDVHPIALHPIGRRVVTLVDRDTDAGLDQPLRQREPADAAADDDDLAKLCGAARGDVLGAFAFGHVVLLTSVVFAPSASATLLSCWRAAAA
jgi:hypothetical protein